MFPTIMKSQAKNDTAMTPPIETTNLERSEFVNTQLWPRFARWLHRRDQLRSLLTLFTVEQNVINVAASIGLRAMDNELQQAVNRFRMANGLSSAAATQRWLVERQLSAPDLEDLLESELLIEKFQQHLLNQHGQAHFDANRSRYERTRLRRLVASSEGAAREFMCRVRDEGVSLAELARDYDIDPTARGLRGDLGVVARWQLPAAVAEAVFAAKPGNLIGPLPLRKGFALFQVEELLPAELDGVTTDKIRQELLDAWTRQRMANVRIDLSGLV